MVKKGTSSNSDTLLLREIAGELENLKAETRAVQHQIHTSMEQNWHLAFADIKPYFDRWREVLNISDLEVFNVTAASCIVGALCSPEQSDRRIAVTPAQFFQRHSPSLYESITLSFASREMGFAFEKKSLLVPFCLFDSVCGLLIGKKDDLQPSDYPICVEETRSLLSQVRAHLLNPTSWKELVDLPRAQ